jgi:cysteine dioxygenase
MARREKQGHGDGAGLGQSPRRRRSGRDDQAPVGGLSRLLAGWDRRDAPLSQADLLRGLRSLSISAEDLKPYVRFGRSAYRRNLVHRGPAYQVLVLCWRSGQRSPIHDHHGCGCAVRVIEGIATETMFERSPCGMVYPTRSLWRVAGSICGKSDDGIHQMGNLQPPGHDLITLHVYSPALTGMRIYTLGNSLNEEKRSTVPKRWVPEVHRQE